MSTADTNPKGFKISIDYADLEVPDLSNPIWHGPHNNATLTIFEAKASWRTVEAESIFGDSVTYLAMLTDIKEGNGEDFLYFAHYAKHVPSEEICSHLLSTVYLQYVSQLAALVPKNTTLH